MNKIYILCILLCALGVNGQSKRRAFFESTHFDDYVVSQIRYTIVNQNNVGPGLKLNLGKTEISGTAAFKSKDPIHTIDFSISANDKDLFNLSSNGSPDSKFKVSYNYNWIPYKSYTMPKGNKYDISIAINKYSEKKNYINILSDSLMAQLYILKKVDSLFNAKEYLEDLIDKDHRITLSIVDRNINSLVQGTELIDGRTDSLIKGVIIKYTKVKKVNLDTLRHLDTLRLYSDIKSKLIYYVYKYDTLSTTQANLLGPFHARGVFFWHTLSPSIDVIPTKAINNLKLEDIFVLKASVRYLFNILKRNDKKYELFRFGAQVSYNNNLDVLKKDQYTFMSTKTIVKSDTVSIVQQEKADAYMKSSINHGFGFSIIGEYFRIPAQSGLVPGVSILSSFGYNGSINVKNDRLEWPLEIGLTFNVLSDEKKAIYLLPYLSFANILRYASDSKFFHREWIFGIKVGLPFGVASTKKK